MLQKRRIIGVRRFNDQVEGKAYNFTKLRVELPVPRNATNEMGCDVVDVTWGDATNYDKLSHLKFPLDMEIDLEITSKGTDCFDLKIPQGQSMKAAA